MTKYRGLYHDNEQNLLQRHGTALSIVLLRTVRECSVHALKKDIWFLAAIYNTGLPIILHN